jgi:hypothetical protein
MEKGIRRVRTARERRNLDSSDGLVPFLARQFRKLLPAIRCKNKPGAIVDPRAAPHCPAGHFSPEKDAGSSRVAFLSTMVDGEIVDYSVLLPFYGEKMAVAR